MKSYCSYIRKVKVVRVVRIETSRGRVLRPAQRIYPLECVTPNL